MRNAIILLLLIIIATIIICWGYFTEWKYIPEKCPQTSNLTQENSSNERLSFQNLLKKIDKGLKPKTWGPPTWYALHAMSFGYSDYPTKEEKIHAYNFFSSLPFMIACGVCGKHCKEYIMKNPPNIDSKKELTKWLVDFHNTVSKRVGDKKIKLEELEEHFKENNMCGGINN